MTATDTRLAAGFRASVAGLKAIEDDLRARADDVARMIGTLEKHWVDLANPISLSELLDRIGEPTNGKSYKARDTGTHSEDVPTTALPEHSSGDSGR